MSAALIGIMSDSHGDVQATARAVRLLLDRGATALIHCGDICGMSVLAELAGHDSLFVWGNCDEPAAAWQPYVAALGLPWPTRPVRRVLHQRRVAVYHGHETAFRRELRDLGGDYIFYGHSHQRADHCENGCRLINPGALHRADIRTVALVDLQSGARSFLAIDDGREVPVPSTPAGR